MSRCKRCQADVYWVDALFLSGHVGRLALDAAPSADGRWRIGSGFTAVELTGVHAFQAVSAGERLHQAHRETCGADHDRAALVAA